MNVSSLFVSKAACALLCLAGVAAAQEEVKWAPFNPTNPALQGFLGVPGCGNFLSGGLVWHRSGKIITMESWKSGIHPVSFWQPDAKTMRATRGSLLNVGDAWCISQQGDLLCAHSRSMADEPGLDPAKNGQAWMAGAFGCFRVQDGTRLWKLPMRQGESVSGAVFTPDDKKVAVLSVWNQQMSLRLLDAASGALLQQHDFPGRSSALTFDVTRLMVRGSELWMPNRENGKQVLWRFSLATLKPTSFECPPLERLRGFARLSPDARRILCHTEFDVTCLEFRNGSWDVAFQEDNFRTSPESEFGTLRDVEFTPDSQRLVLVTKDSARVVDLATKKTHQIKLDENSGGTLSPDGSHLLVEHENGMRIVSLRETDATQPERQQQNVWRPHQLRFLGDGKTLLAADQDGIWTWDIATRKPRAWLRGFERHVLSESTFQTLSLIANDSEVLSEEHDDPLRWKLPSLEAPPPEKPQLIAPQLVFGGVRQGWKGTYPGVFVKEDASWILSTNAVQQGVIHSVLGAGSSRSVTGLFPEVAPQLWFFTPDDFLVMRAVKTDNWVRLNLPKGTLEDLPNPSGVPDPDNPRRSVFPQPIGVLPKRQFVVRQFNDRVCVTSLDGKTQLPWFEAPVRGFEVPNMRAGVSQDEKRCACVLVDFVRRHQHVFVWEVETGKLVGYAPLPTNDATCVALSPDGSLLACGHENTAISLWDVAKLTVPAAPAAVPAPATPAPASTKSATASPPAAAPLGTAPSQPSTKRRDHMFGSGIWDFIENGTVSKAEVLPEAGRLRINGTEFEMKGHRLNHPSTINRLFHAQQDFRSETAPNRADPRFTPLSQNQLPEVSAGLIHLSEGSADGVWVSRQTGNPVNGFHQFLTFTDTLTNLSGQDKQAEIDFEVRFPAQTQQLVDSNLQQVKVNDEGILQIRPDVVWLAALPASGTLRSVPVFWFRSSSGGQSYRLQWKADTHTLTVRHSVLLPAGDPRYLAHGMRIVFLPEGVEPDHFTAPEASDFAKGVVYSAKSRGINFGPGHWEVRDEALWKGASTLADELGSWIRNADGSLQNSTGIASAHQLWLDGAPLPGSSLGVFAFQDDNAALQAPTSLFNYRGFSLDEKVTFLRSPGRSPDQQMPMVIDHITNQQAEPRTVKLAFVSSFSEPIKALYDAKGQPVEPSAAPKMARQLGGSLIVEFDGPTRPATLLAFYQDGAVAEPKVSWPGQKLLKLEYEVTLPPRGGVQFWHGATQRPLASFDSVTAPFTGCLPFQRAPSPLGANALMNVL
ncbi:WD40 repeat domain-containing protein [Prosthecobacter sp.]|uniref:WD40 repeat domain-containing protein n=1 Tax=Prosthecobacter sp. TaxID=1965333 RepID=UPI003783E7C8